MHAHRATALLVSLLLAVMAAPVAASPVAAPTSATDQVWIVTLDDDHPSTQHAEALVRRHGGTLRQVYAHALNGFSFRGPEQAAENLQRSPQVRRVEADRPVRAAGADTRPWGIERIEAPQAHDEGHVGDNVNIAILDTGIDPEHPALDVDLGKNCIDGEQVPTDAHGHGTHVAGTASAQVEEGDFVGAATNATVVPVKVLDDSGGGSWESIICGIDHVTDSLDTSDSMTVANMSLGGAGSAGEDCESSALRESICKSVEAGVVHVVAAGNDGDDAANSVPAAYPEVITVSALDGERCVRVTGGGPPRTECDESLASFSNYGSAVDLIAPGVDITSTVPDDEYATYSGTSMAAPHVAGVAALMRATNPDLTPDQVRDLLQSTGECPNGDENDAPHGPCSSQGQWWQDPDGIAEPLVNAPRAADAAGDPTDPGASEDPVYAEPKASFTYSCTDLTCTFDDASTSDDDLTLTYEWDFDDDEVSDEENPVHTYESGDTYTVTLTITDNEGQSDSDSQTVTVTEPSEDPDDGTTEITLDVDAYKVRGVQHADLWWEGATSDKVRIVRDGDIVAKVDNDGSATDDIDNRGSGSYTYQVCEADSDVCSEEETISF